jgi:hypothetical protein
MQWLTVKAHEYQLWVMTDFGAPKGPKNGLNEPFMHFSKVALIMDGS